MSAQPLNATDTAKARCTSSRWYVRIPLKAFIFAVVTFFVLFPNPAQFARHLSRVNDLGRMVQPDAPELAAWQAELDIRTADALRARTDPEAETARAPAPAEIQRAVQAFVYQKVAYAWDWDVWGAADYIPTVQEMFAKARESFGGHVREDCDGRAVMAASLMRRMGFRADLVTDLRHVWVVTPQGEWMGPGESKAVSTTDAGTQIAWGTAIANLPMSLSYGIAVFPLARELIILATACALMLHRRMPRRSALLGALLLLQGLLFMRCGVLLPQKAPGFTQSWPAFVGLLHVIGGFGLLWTASRKARRGEAGQH